MAIADFIGGTLNPLAAGAGLPPIYQLTNGPLALVPVTGTPSSLAVGTFGLFRDTVTGRTCFWVNDGGTLKNLSDATAY